MTGPEDQAAAGRDRLRVSHADRERAIETLKDAFVQGRVTRDELDARADRVLAARTYADLAALTADVPAADIPAGPAAAAPARPPTPVRHRQPLVRAAAGVGRLRGRRVCRPADLRRHRDRAVDGPRARSPSFLASRAPCRGCCRRSRGTVHLGVRGGHLTRDETLP